MDTPKGDAEVDLGKTCMAQVDDSPEDSVDDPPLIIECGEGVDAPAVITFSASDRGQKVTLSEIQRDDSILKECHELAQSERESETLSTGFYYKD